MSTLHVQLLCDILLDIVMVCIYLCNIHVFVLYLCIHAIHSYKEHVNCVSLRVLCQCVYIARVMEEYVKRANHNSIYLIQLFSTCFLLYLSLDYSHIINKIFTKKTYILIYYFSLLTCLCPYPQFSQAISISV